MDANQVITTQDEDGEFLLPDEADEAMLDQVAEIILSKKEESE